jgi:membrane-bound serine protease (ClpP class)
MFRLMKSVVAAILAACIGLVLASAHAASRPVIVLPLAGAIGPASADFVVRGMAHAERDNAQLIVLQIDTPGGLDTSMRQIIKSILSSSVPVAAYVAPGGARAASAGTYILYASHLAAMAPGTNLGAATPVQIGLGGGDLSGPADTEGKKAPGEDKGQAKESKDAKGGNEHGAMAKKQMHDAAAYIRGLAQLRGRNAAWGERAVREAVSLSADEALEQHVTDVTARDLRDLLARLDGRKVVTVAGERVLDTAAAPLITLEPDWKTRLLAAITDPSIALILMMIGIYGLFFEFYNPGFMLPGVAGAICLLLGLFALQMLPVNYAGLALIVLGIAFMVAEMFLATFGVLGVGGIVAFAFGALMLIDTDQPGFGISKSLIAGLSMATMAFIFFISSLALRARRRPPVSGADMAGGRGIMLDDATAEGWARVQGERWQVRCAQPLKRHQEVRIIARDGLTLTVEPIGNQEE